MNKTRTAKPFPAPIPLKQLIGPSFILLALGLGSGEVILWPFLASNYGLGIAWAAIVGISFQYMINMEIERYALVKGESVFVGIAKLWRSAPYWFIFSTFIGFGLPGIVAASANVVASLIGAENHVWIAMVMLLVIGVVLSSGKTVYGMMERITTSIIVLGVPFIFILTLVLTSLADWSVLGQGLIGHGEGYRWVPEGMIFATFLAAFAYSGAGGNLNLTQSIYIKEKGYGMGKYAQRIGGLFRTGAQNSSIELEGVDSTQTVQDIQHFKGWWRRISIEHALVFWLIGSVSILLLMLLAYVTTSGVTGNEHGIQFIINQGSVIAQVLSPGVGAAFLFVVAVMLFQTQLGVMDSTSRIMAENAAISYARRAKTRQVPLSKIYFLFLWAQIAFGICLFVLGISEPKSLIVLGAVLNAISMFVHVGLVSWLNYRSLPTVFQPRLFRRLILLGIFLFFGFFSGFVIVDTLF